MDESNKYIGTIIYDKKVIFKVNDNIYIKKYKEKGKISFGKYVIGENVNIKVKNLNDKYAIIESKNQVYYNKILLVLNVVAIFMGMLGFSILEMLNIQGISVDLYTISKSIILSTNIFGFVFLLAQWYYVIFKQKRKLYKNRTDIIEGKIISYQSIEYRTNNSNTKEYEYNIMYKYKLPNGKIIHSVVHNCPADYLYENYPIDKKVMVKYNPNVCCESCLLDEYESIFNKKQFIKSRVPTTQDTAIITNIKTICIDEEIEDYLKEYNLVDYVECEYTKNDVTYKEYSKYPTQHKEFNIGDKITICIEYENHKKFYCNKKRR